MILVFGGTTEGKRVISLLNEMQLPFVYSTKTKVETELGDFGKARSGALDVEGLKTVLNQESAQLIINAAHPFAKELHQTIDEVSKEEHIKVLRLERKYVERTENELIKYLETYDQIIEVLIQHFQGKNLLALTGVQSIEKFKPFWKNNTSYFRILDRQSSLDISDRSDFPRTQLILEQPEKLVGGEEKLVDRLEIDIIVTKESGSTGALEQKIEIALKKQIPIYILTKPVLPKSFIQIQNIEELKSILPSSFLPSNTEPNSSFLSSESLTPNLLKK